MATLLLDNEHLRIEAYEERRVMVIARTPTLPRVGDLLAAYDQALALLEPEYRGWGLVIDTRDAPGRNDPKFEEAIAGVRREASRRFARVVVLVRTAVGELQVSRLGRQDDMTIRVTRDFDEAMSWAAG